MKKQYIIPIFVPHLGCPNNCTFCNQKIISGETKEITPDDVKKTVEFYLESFKEKNKYTEIAFFGGSFTGIEIEKQEALLKAAFEFVKAKKVNTPIISAMGAGNKMDPTRFEVADISKTSVCPLAKVIRTELRKRRIKGVKVVYSKELPIKPKEDMSISCKSHCVCPPGTRKCTVKHQIPGSNAFVPPVVGLIIAGEVIKDLIDYKIK